MSNVFEHPDGVIPAFESLTAFRDYMFFMREQAQKEEAAGGRRRSVEKL